MNLQSVIKLLRVHQWTKNLFIFLPMFFAMKITNAELLLNAFFLFLGFSFVASSIYVFNDFYDIESDKLHPKKKFRPLASGEINKTQAIIIMAVIFTTGISLIVFRIQNINVLLLLTLYVVQNIFYTIKLKQIPIVDITIVSIGFVIRIFLGGEATNTILSHWIVLMTFILAMFLALAKRSDDVRIMDSTRIELRKSLQGYNIEFLNICMSIMAVIIIITFIMYTTSPEIIERIGDHTYLTSFFVIIGVLRYLQISLVLKDSGSPTIILMKDVFLQVVIAGWILSFILLIYM